MKFSATFGFKSWKHGTCPCFYCFADQDGLRIAAGLRSGGMPFPRRTFADYEVACSRCEIVIDPLNENAWRKFRRLLFYDQRPGSGTAKGRALACDVPELGLLRGDRLEPSIDVPDVGQGFDETCPPRCTFWRTSEETFTNHRNPLFDEELGTEHDKVICVDDCHCASLGVYQVWNGFIMWELFKANALEIPYHVGGDSVRLTRFVEKVKALLMSWYRDEAGEGREHTRVQDMAVSMLGPEDNTYLGLHAAEGNGFVRFLSTLLKAKARFLGDRVMLVLKTHLALVSNADIMTDTPPGEMPPDLARRFVDNARCVLEGFEALGVIFKPKMHMYMHLAADTHFKGSPRFYACWVDETLNRLLKDVSAGSHRRVYHKRVLVTVNEALQRKTQCLYKQK